MSVTVGEYLEDLLEKCGGFGKFQIILVLILFATKVSVTWTMLMMSFAGAEPDWWCNEYHGNDTSVSFKACTMTNITECSKFRYDDNMVTVMSEVTMSSKYTFYQTINFRIFDLITYNCISNHLKK